MYTVQCFIMSQITADFKAGFVCTQDLGYCLNEDRPDQLIMFTLFCSDGLPAIIDQ